MRNAAIQRLIHDSPVIAFFCAASLLCCALLFFAAIPQWSAHAERLERVSHYDKYLSSADGFDTARRRLESKNELLASKLAVISPDAPPRTLPDILQELIRRGKECGVTLSKIQPQSEIKSADAEYIPVLLETSADYLKLGKYIASLEALPQTLQIRKLAVETTRGGELNVKLLVNCRIADEGGR
jgi:Tfp pilus assembly protein PilO